MKVGPLKLKLQLLCGDGFALGPGKADLLEAIGQEGSISAAGRALGMSYRRTWLLADEMNRCFDGPLIETSRGGGRDRGARLTPLGREMLAAYRELDSAMAAIGDHPAYARLLQNLRDTPLPPAH